MPTPHRENGFDFRFYSNDHLSMHVHAVKGGEVCVFFPGDIVERIDDEGKKHLEVVEEVHIRENKGMNKADVRRALLIVKKEQFKLVKAWHEHLG